ncbi:MAG: hypothetical protein C0412_01500 [Flavobacterium sp.]|nr:hypothetical protein [Flavobacterium sp.]
MDLKQELVREEKFWDQVGDKWLKEIPNSKLILKNPEEYLSGSSYSFENLMIQMGDIVNTRILDYGCGSGWLSVYLATKGANVYGFDISTKLVELGRKRALINNLSDKVTLKKMIAEELEYPDNYFDKVIGISILHHVNLEQASKELTRVLKPGGSAFFIEPLGEWNLINILRNTILRIHHGFIRSIDAEHPLRYKDINNFGKPFTSTKYKEFQLTEMIARLTGDRLTRLIGLHKLDDILLQNFKILRKFCRLIVIEYKK